MGLRSEEGRRDRVLGGRTPCRGVEHAFGFPGKECRCVDGGRKAGFPDSCLPGIVEGAGWQGESGGESDGADAADVPGHGRERLHRPRGECTRLLSGAEGCEGSGGTASFHRGWARLRAASIATADLAVAGACGDVAPYDSHPWTCGPATAALTARRKKILCYSRPCGMIRPLLRERAGLLFISDKAFIHVFESPPAALACGQRCGALCCAVCRAVLLGASEFADI